MITHLEDKPKSGAHKEDCFEWRYATLCGVTFIGGDTEHGIANSNTEPTCEGCKVARRVVTAPIKQIEAFIKDCSGPWIMSRIGSFGVVDASMTLWWKHDHQVILSLRSKTDIQDLDVGVYYGTGHMTCIHDLDFGAPLLTRAAARVVDVMQLYGVSVGDLHQWLQDPVRAQLRQRAAKLLALADGEPPCS